ncbi:MAG: hypothetical protein AAB463_00090 [Patescibacteria group bacterium]
MSIPFSTLQLGQIVAIGNKIGGEEGIRRLLADELMVVERAPKLSPNATANGGITYASSLNAAAFLSDWAEFYKIYYGREIDLSTVPLPPITVGFGWGVVVLPGLTPQLVFEKSRELFSCWKYDERSLDEVIDLAKEQRATVTDPYVVWCRDRIEADEELKNTSAHQVKERGITTMTLSERELLEQWYFWKSCGDHLDKQNVTLCAGSRRVGGYVPGADWDDGQGFCVGWYDVSNSGDHIRARQVVSLPATPAA